MIFTTYIKNKPVGIHECPDWEVEFVANGLAYIEGEATQTQYIKDNKFVDFPEKPSDVHTWDWDSLSWVINDSSTIDIIIKRNSLLSSSDWTQLPNNPLTLEEQEEWALYRQQLRDIPSQSGYPLNIIWPIKP